MPEFAWQARTAQGAAIRGRRVAADVRELTRQLAESGLILTRCSDAASSRARTRHALRMSRKERILITQQLADSLGAGISLLETLDELAQGYPRRSVRKMFATVLAQIEGGSTLSDALELYEEALTRPYVRCIRAAESSGRLAPMFHQLAEEMEWQEEIASKVTSALIYPCVLLSAVVGIGVLFVTVLLPKFEPVFATLGGELPFLTRLLLASGDTVRAFWPALLIGLGIAVFGGRALVKTEQGRLFVDRLKISIPVIRSVNRSLIVGRFTGAMANLLEAGVSLPEALTISAWSAGNSVVERQLARSRQRVLAGRSLADSLESLTLLRRLDRRMIHVGERAGELVRAFGSLSRLHGKYARRQVQRAVLLIEPATILVLAVLVLGLALSILMPIYQSLDAIGG